jgi:hypothetical protein
MTLAVSFIEDARATTGVLETPNGCDKAPNKSNVRAGQARCVSRPEELKLEPKATPPLTPLAAIPQQRPDSTNFAWIPPDAQRYLRGGTI